MNDKVYDLLLKLPRKNLIHLMWGALDIMEGSCQTRQGCILESMGAEVSDNMKTGGFKYRLPPTLKEIKENTDSLGL
jgi:hypothetical protein